MKKLLSIALCICLTLAAVFTAVPSFATKANADTEAAQTLIGSYVNGGNYIKDTVIYTEATGAKYFHAGADSTTRRTVYSKNGTQLFMTTGENVYGAGYRDVTVDEVKKVERYYTNESGEHRSYLVNKTSIKDWFTDLEEMATLGTWSLVDGKYESTLQAEHKQLWRDFVAPMWIGSAEVFTKVVAYESAGSLVLELCDATAVFAKATIKKPVDTTYTFGEYPAGTQYAKDEEHVLDENVTCTTTQAHFTSELRLYSSSTNNGYAIFQSANSIIDIAVNAGNKVDTLNVYGSNDGANWYLTGTISVTSTSYKDYALTLGASYKWIKLDVAGDQQIRLKSITLTTVPAPACEHADTTETTVDATCTEDGLRTVTCDICGKTLSKETIEAKGHSYVDGSCSVCGEKEPNANDPTWQLATSIKVDDTVTLVCETKKMELSSISSYGEGVSYTETPAGAYKLTVVAGSTTGTYAFKTEDGEYLSWSSGNSLTTSTTLNANSSWKVTFNDDTTTIENAADNTRKLQWNASNPRFACYTSSQTAIQIYKYAVVCDHTYDDVVVTAPTCTTAGYTTHTCTKCGESKTDSVVDALGHSYVETERTDATCTEVGSVTKTCSTCNDTKTEEIKATGHNFVAGVCSVCGEAESAEPTLVKKWVKVTEAPEDWSGEYLIVYEDGKVAFNGGLTTLDAASNTISVTITNSEIAYSDETQNARFIIAKSGSNYTIKSASDKYIGATSDKNSLNTGATAYTNTISLNSDKTVNIIGSGGAYLRFNSASDQNRFRYYKSSSYTNQKAICLYKLVEVAE